MMPTNAAVKAATNLLKSEGFDVRPPMPKCRECNDRGYYTFWSGRGEKGEFYCPKNCEAAIDLKARDIQERGNRSTDE